MKSTGVVRRVDQLGRIVLPKELRSGNGIKKYSNLEIYVDGDKIILKKYHRGCIFCGEINGTVIFKDRILCGKCKDEINK